MELPRRSILRLGGGALFSGLVCSVGTPAFAELIAAKPRTLSLESLHTGEKFNGEYWANGKYLPDALERINHVLRDRRNNKVHEIDPKLLDTLSLLRGQMGRAADPYLVICGYRSAESNAKMAAASSGVAKNSLHVQGKAIDVRMPGCALKTLHGAALSMRCGGVGYYPRSDFVHIDTGRVRTWNGA
jgi:uncharacterized protein YcbK (DUF882 family)